MRTKEEKAKAKFEKKKEKARRKAENRKEPKVKVHQKRDARIRWMQHWTAFIWQGGLRHSTCRVGFHFWTKWTEPKQIEVIVDYETKYDRDFRRVRVPIIERRHYQHRICHCCSVLNKKRYKPV